MVGVVLVLVLVGVETIVMAGRKGSGAGWTIGDIGATAGAGRGLYGCGGIVHLREREWESWDVQTHIRIWIRDGNRLKPPLQVPHQSLSPRRLRIRGRASVSGWCLRLLSDKVRIEPGGELVR